MNIKKHISIFLFALTIASLASCSFFGRELLPEEAILARVNESYLFESDMIIEIPKELPAEDSLVWVRNYIHNWVRDQLLIKQAEENLTNEQKNFNKELKDYYNSLLIFAYEKRLVNQEIDTNITNREVLDYYEKYHDNFVLKENICKATFASICADSINTTNEIRRIFLEDTIDYYQLEHICQLADVDFSIDTNIWYNFDQLQKLVPIKTLNPSHYLSQNKTTETKSDNKYYFLRIEEYQLKDSVSPLKLVRKRIKSIIMNRNKALLINNLRKSIFQQAEDGVDYDIY